jgi:drug/metabolite transporter (DMT)-like permease
MTWIVFALMSAVLWGLSYVLYEQLIKSISPASAMFYTAMGTFLFYAGWSAIGGTLNRDWQIIKNSGYNVKLILAIIVINSAANLLGLYSMKAKSATAMGLLEISYPLFVALFAWLLFKENQLSMGLLLGGGLIMSGVICIIYFDKPI